MGLYVQLAQEKHMSLGNVRHFVIDECDKVLDTIGEAFLPVYAHLDPLALF